MTDRVRWRHPRHHRRRLRHFVSCVAVVVAACVNRGDDARPAAGETAVAPDALEGEACQAATAPQREWTCVIAADLVVKVTIADTDSSFRVAAVRGDLQPLTIKAEDTFDYSSATVTAADLDGDGRRELMIRRDIGHPNNSGYDIWYLDPVRHALLLDSLLTSETNVSADSTGCVRTQEWLGGSHTIERRYCLGGGRRWIMRWERTGPDST
jgi:hypothetical protein